MFSSTAAVLLLCGSPATNGKLTEFKSEKHAYTLNYPNEWYLRSPVDHFNLFSFPRSEAIRGAVVPRGGAFIGIQVPEFFMQQGDAMPKDLDGWVRLGTRYQEIVSTRVLAITDGRPSVTVVEIKTRCCATPPFFEGTTWYFQIDGKFLAVSLEHYQGEKRAAEFRGVFERIAKSLKVLQ
jgi:hypothetical protein